jgi:hypothetical protein
MLGPVRLYINIVYISWMYKNFENTVTRAKISVLHKDDIGFKSLPMSIRRLNFYLIFNL